MATEIILSIPDQYVDCVLNAFTGLANKQINLMTMSDNFNGNWSYSYEPKQSGENNKDFAIRVIKENIRAIVRLYDYIEDKKRYVTEVEAISPASQDIPDEIIE